MPGHTNEERAIVAVIRWPPSLGVRLQRCDVLLECGHCELRLVSNCDLSLAIQLKIPTIQFGKLGRVVKVASQGIGFVGILTKNRQV
jgi:hypothetical protein